jgi:sugar O-acyltransferase (sialic acid O-acetyltransferase NeuD family)
MTKSVYLLGGGGHGRVVLDALLSSNVNVAGVLDPDLKTGDHVFRIPVMGGDEFLDQLAPTDVLLINGLGANPYVGNRKILFERMKSRGFLFDMARHPFTVIGRECDLGEGSHIMAGAVLQNRTRIGNNVVINTCASLDHDCVLGIHAFISPGAKLCGNVTISESAFIGAGAIILPGIQIGADAVVGAGAVVTKNVSDGWVVAGNPAVMIGMNK